MRTKKSINEKDIICNFYPMNTIALKYVICTLTDLQGDIDRSMTIERDFFITISQLLMIHKVCEIVH